MKKGILLPVAILSALILVACTSQQATPTPIPTAGITPTSTSAPTLTPTEAPTPTPTKRPTSTPTPTPTSTPTPEPVSSGPLEGFFTTEQKTLFVSDKFNGFWCGGFNEIFELEGGYVVVREKYSKLEARAYDPEAVKQTAEYKRSKNLYFMHAAMESLTPVKELAFTPDEGFEYYNYHTIDGKYLIVYSRKNLNIGDAPFDIKLSFYDAAFDKKAEVLVKSVNGAEAWHYNEAKGIIYYSAWGEAKQGNDVYPRECLYSYSCQTGESKLVFSYDMLPEPEGYPEGCNIDTCYFEKVTDDELLFKVAWCDNRWAIPDSLTYYSYDLNTGKLTRRKGELYDSDEYTDEAGKYVGYEEPNGNRSIYGQYGKIHVCDKDGNDICTIIPENRNYSEALTIQPDWDNNVVITENGAYQDPELHCYSMETGKLVSSVILKTTMDNWGYGNNEIDPENGILFTSVTSGDKELLYAWEYLKSTVAGETVPEGFVQTEQKNLFVSDKLGEALKNVTKVYGFIDKYVLIYAQKADGQDKVTSYTFKTFDAKTFEEKDVFLCSVNPDAEFSWFEVYGEYDYYNNYVFGCISVYEVFKTDSDSNKKYKKREYDSELKLNKDWSYEHELTVWAAADNNSILRGADYGRMGELYTIVAGGKSMLAKSTGSSCSFPETPEGMHVCYLEVIGQSSGDHICRIAYAKEGSETPSLIKYYAFSAGFDPLPDDLLTTTEITGYWSVSKTVIRDNAELKVFGESNKYLCSIKTVSPGETTYFLLDWDVLITLEVDGNTTKYRSYSLYTGEMISECSVETLYNGADMVKPEFDAKRGCLLIPGKLGSGADSKDVLYTWKFDER